MMTVAQVDSGRYVASRGGRRLGFIDMTADGHYIAFDGFSEPVGRYTSLAGAKAVLRGAPVSVLERRTRAGEVAAVAVGSIVGIAAIAAGAMMSFL